MLSYLADIINGKIDNEILIEDNGPVKLVDSGIYRISNTIVGIWDFGDSRYRMILYDIKYSDTILSKFLEILKTIISNISHRKSLGLFTREFAKSYIYIGKYKSKIPLILIRSSASYAEDSIYLNSSLGAITYQGSLFHDEDDIEDDMILFKMIKAAISDIIVTLDNDLQLPTELAFIRVYNTDNKFQVRYLFDIDNEKLKREPIDPEEREGMIIHNSNRVLNMIISLESRYSRISYDLFKYDDPYFYNMYSR